jgi:hypothetical protein
VVSADTDLAERDADCEHDTADDDRRMVLPSLPPIKRRRMNAICYDLANGRGVSELQWSVAPRPGIEASAECGWFIGL